MLLMGAKPVAPAMKRIGRWPVVQREATHRPFEFEHVAFAHALEDLGGEAPARHQAHMQFDRPARARGVGEGEGAPGVVFEHDVDVLPGLEGERFARRQGQLEPHHVGAKAAPCATPWPAGAARAGSSARPASDGTSTSNSRSSSALAQHISAWPRARMASVRAAGW
jgi:hypothetical protein